MPIIDRSVRQRNLTAANARAADVASKLTSTIAPIVQERFQSAFRVQGLQGILLNRLTQGRSCSCVQRNNQVSQLSPDGKASPGAINRILSGSNTFGIGHYTGSPDEDLDSLTDEDINKILSVDNVVGPGGNELDTGPAVGDNGQFSPDLDALLGNFDLSHLGLTDVSCPICFGSTYIGGYSMFRGQRQVIVPADLTTTSFLDPLTFELTPGTHTTTVVLPRGAIRVDAFRAMLKNKPVAATFAIDGTSLGSGNVLAYCDGRPHTLAITATTNITHVEIQFALSNESVYFEIPKLSKTQDISLLDPQEPFQIIVSPEVPTLNALDIIIESQLGKVLVVGQVNPWNTRNRDMLGHEAQVRVAQPQEIWNILSRRLPTTGQKATVAASPANNNAGSGFVNPAEGFSF